MMTFRITAVFLVAIACNFQSYTSLALTTTATTSCQQPGHAALIGSQRQCNAFGILSRGSFHVLNASPEPDADDWTDDSGPTKENQQEKMPPTNVPQPPTPARNSPEAVAQRRMDPLMASLTRDNSNATPDEPTQTVPFFGEIPADGTLFLLVPAVLFASLGFIMSIVIAVKSSDQIVGSFSQVGDNVAQIVAEQPNRSYDENVCRGICSTQQDDVDGLYNFMEMITRSAREKQSN